MIRVLMGVVGCVTLLAFLLVGGGSAIATPVLVFGAFTLRTMEVLSVGIAIGLFFIVAFGRYLGIPTTADSLKRIGHAATVPVIAIVAGLLATVAVAHGQLPAINAALAYILGMTALISGIRCTDALGRGESLGVESHWGGLGGSSGGWRLLPATGLAILTLSFTGAAIAVAVGDRKPQAADTDKVGMNTVSANNTGDDEADEAGKDAAPANTLTGNVQVGNAL